MSSHLRLTEAIKRALEGSGILEVAACGEFILPATKPTLFPGAVYGFGVCLNQEERRALFDEARARGSARLAELEQFKPIEGLLYPIYWGKDKQLGARPYQHLQNPKKTGAIRLSTYSSLRGKTIACAAIVVSDNVEAERVIQKAFPNLLKCSTSKYELPEDVK